MSTASPQYNEKCLVNSNVQQSSVDHKWGGSEDDVDGESDISDGSVMKGGDGVRRGGGRRVAGKSDDAGKL
ncbi:hypothetical protein Tco_0163740 [Tanacetum coccineum]